MDPDLDDQIPDDDGNFNDTPPAEDDDGFFPPPDGGAAPPPPFATAAAAPKGPAGAFGRIFNSSHGLQPPAPSGASGLAATTNSAGASARSRDRRGGGGVVNAGGETGMGRASGPAGAGASNQAALPPVQLEQIRVSRDVYAVEQALRYRALTRPNAAAPSPAEQQHTLGLILSYFIHNGFTRAAEALHRCGSSLYAPGIGGAAPPASTAAAARAPGVARVPSGPGSPISVDGGLTAGLTLIPGRMPVEGDGCLSLLPDGAGPLLRDGPYRDLPRLVGQAVEATSELFDDDTAWDSELIFRFFTMHRAAEQAQRQVAESLHSQHDGGDQYFSGDGGNAFSGFYGSGATGAGGLHEATFAHPSVAAAITASVSAPTNPTHDMVVLDERSKTQLGTIEYLVSRLLLGPMEQREAPFDPRGRLEASFTNCFLATISCFCTPDAFISKCLKLFKALQLHATLLGETFIVRGSARLLTVLAAFASSNRIDVSRTSLERLLQFALGVIAHAERTTGPSAAGAAVVAAAAEQLCAVVEALEASAARDADSLRARRGPHGTFGGDQSGAAVSARGFAGSHPYGPPPGTTGGGATLMGGAGVGGGADAPRWAPVPFCPITLAPLDTPRPAPRGDGALWRLTDIPEIEIARQLSLLHFELFRQIHPRELLNAAWMQPSLQPCSAGLLRFVRQEEAVAQWVASCIVVPADLGERRAAYARSIRVMRSLFDMHNFSLAAAFLSGVENPNVRRMHQTVAAQALTEDEVDSLRIVRAALDPFHGSVKSLPHDFDVPCVPLLAPYVSEACRLHDLQATLVRSVVAVLIGTSGATGAVATAAAVADMATTAAGASGASATTGGASGDANTLTKTSDPSSTDAAGLGAARRLGKTVDRVVTFVNWTKMAQYGKLMLRLKAYQSRPYPFAPDPLAQRLLQRLPLMRQRDETLLAMSKEREPPVVSAAGGGAGRM